MLKIVITGPESTGKTTLAHQLAGHFTVPWVREYAREYIDNLDREYEQRDLLEIARGQLNLEEAVLATKPKFLLCDTDLLTILIWSEYKYGHCDPQILKWISERPYDHYLLCAPDIPWAFDPQRENPENREELYQLYKTTLEEYGKSYTALSGNSADRLKNAIQTIHQLDFA